ncbi:MAG: YvcK family protein [Vampirovibrionales bacterium]|nr:YvcK family protein [Vampirovibrionales bacterium]
MPPFERSASNPLLSLLFPGLAIKRWLIIVAVGGLLVLLGGALLLNLQPISALVRIMQSVALMMPSYLSGSLAIGLGIALVYMGGKKASRTVMGAAGASDKSLLTELVRSRRLSLGPKIVAIGGGTGLSTLLRGLKHYTTNITAIVTVGDDGGSSGRLRKDHGIIPPGDIRNCIAALADEEQLITELFQYRFNTGEGLEGHSFGNLFLTAMCHVTGDMLSAIRASSAVLNISGRVLPSTLESIALSAELTDGSTVNGESNIPDACKENRLGIKRLMSLPADAKPLPDAITAIEEADLILLGPGSLYTSVIPNLLIGPIKEAITKRAVPKVYIANAMTQPGETDGFSVSDHVRAILEHAGETKAGLHSVVSTVFANRGIPSPLASRYREAGYEEVRVDRDECDALGVAVVEAQLINPHAHKIIRHDSRRLARFLFHWFRAQSTPSETNVTSSEEDPTPPRPKLTVISGKASS